MAQPTQVRQIRISVDTKGNQALKDLADKLGGVNRNTKSLAGNVGFLKNVFIGWFGAMQVGTLANLSDSMQQLFDRITVLSGGTQQAKSVLEELTVIANRTKTGVDDLATVYARLAATTKDTGIKTESLLQLTEVLQNSFRLSGATISEATAATIQLSQGFASGQLRGQELRSVLEQNVAIGDILTKTFGKTRGEIYKMAEAGQLTSGKVMKALFDNMEEVNGKAAQLSQTFDQTLTVALNNFKLKLLEVNKEFDLSGNFAKGIDFLIQRLGLITTVLAAIATTYIPALVVKLKVLGAAVYAALGPIGLTIAAASIVIVAFFDDLDDLKDALYETGIAASDFISRMSKLGESAAKEGGPLVAGLAVGLRFLSRTFDSASTSLQKAREEAELLELVRRDIEGQHQLLDQRSARQANKKLLEGLANQSIDKEKKLKEILGEINKEYLAGRINAVEYQKALNSFDQYKATREFRDGKTDLEKYRLELLNLKNVQLAQELADWQITMGEFNRQVRQNDLEALNVKLQAGSITLKQYNEELLKLSDKISITGPIQVGFTSFVDSVGTFSQLMAESIKNAFSTLEDEMFKATKNGRFDFATFTQAILDDLTRITIRALILKPLIESITGAFGASIIGTPTQQPATVGLGMQAAKGASFEGGIRKFAKGGLVSSPTLFGYGGGSVGLMGEAGTEAILPLRRGADGNLGVAGSQAAVMINIINNTGADVQQTERSGANGEKVIDVLITKKVNDGFARGAFDKQLKTSFGLDRRGS